MSSSAPSAAQASTRGPGLDGHRRGGGDAPEGRTTVRVGVVAALPEEGEAVIDRLEDVLPVEVQGGEGSSTVVRRGVLAGVPTAVAVTGDGRRKARDGISDFFRSVAMERLVVVGVGGALTSDMEPCSLILAREVRLGERRRLRPAPALVEAAREATGLRTGVVVTVDDILDTAEAKAATLRGLEEGNGSGEIAAVADLETAHYVAEAEGRGIPWLVLRGVSDGADEGLPPFLNRCRDEGGAVRRSAVVRQLFLHPWALPDLLRLRRRVECCAGKLAGRVRTLVEVGA